MTLEQTDNPDTALKNPLIKTQYNKEVSSYQREEEVKRRKVISYEYL